MNTNKKIFNGVVIGILSGLISLIAYAIIINLFVHTWAIIFWHPSIIDIVDSLRTQFYYFGIYLIIPFAFICTFTSIIFILILVATSRLNEGVYTGICSILCIGVALKIYAFTTGMVYNIDEETANMMNFIFRNIPYTLFVVWGYFLSRYFYRNFKKSSNDQPSPS